MPVPNSVALVAQNCRQYNPMPQPAQKPTGVNKFCTVLFWIAIMVFAYCVISVMFPIQSVEYFAWTDKYLTRYSDPFGFNASYYNYYEEWMPAALVSRIIAVIAYVLKKRKS